MPIIAALIGALIAAIGSFIVQALIGLAFGVVTYTGMQVAMDWFLNGFISNINSLPSQLVQVIALLRFDSAISIIMSAITVRLVMQGLNQLSGRMSSLRMMR